MKTKILGAITALFMVTSSYAQDGKATISKNQLPTIVNKNITKYFGNKNITHMVKDWDNGRVSYDIYFEDGTEAEFFNNGNLKEAKNYSGLSNSIIPANIRNYVSKNFPGTSIVKWEKSRNKQEIELSNGVGLDFDLRGNFLRIDD